VLKSGQVQFRGDTGSAIESYGDLVAMAHEVNFPPKGNQPGITGVKIDPSALASGHFHLEVGFESPFPLSPPVPGFVIYSASGVPVYGSNPRFHSSGYNSSKMSRGTISFKVEDLPLCGGHYRLSVWLGDWQGDYDYRPGILAFEFKNGSDNTGYLELVGQWQIIKSDRGVNPLRRLEQPQNA
jgi:lipopolysaccharide transport system ATP-binding protein